MSEVGLGRETGEEGKVTAVLWRKNGKRKGKKAKYEKGKERRGIGKGEPTVRLRDCACGDEERVQPKV
jgi:hypothetical protein